MLSKLIVCLTVIFTPETIPSEAGTYLVEFSYDDNQNEVKTVVPTTVLDENTVVEGDVVVDAKNFSVGSQSKIDEEMVLDLSEAKSWNASTMKKYDIENVAIEKVDEYLYRATIYSVGNINTTIDITVREDEVSDNEFVSSSMVEYCNNDDCSLTMQELLVIGMLIITTFYSSIMMLNSLYNKQMRKNAQKLKKTNTDVN